MARRAITIIVIVHNQSFARVEIAPVIREEKWKWIIICKEKLSNSVNTIYSTWKWFVIFFDEHSTLTRLNQQFCRPSIPFKRNDNGNGNSLLLAKVNWILTFIQLNLTCQRNKMKCAIFLISSFPTDLWVFPCLTERFCDRWQRIRTFYSTIIVVIIHSPGEWA